MAYLQNKRCKIVRCVMRFVVGNELESSADQAFTDQRVLGVAESGSGFPRCFTDRTSITPRGMTPRSRACLLIDVPVERDANHSDAGSSVKSEDCRTV